MLSAARPGIRHNALLHPFSDNFNRPDGVPGNGWFDVRSDAATSPTIISSNRIQPTVSSKGNNFMRDVGIGLGIDMSADFVGIDFYKVMYACCTVNLSSYIQITLTDNTSYVVIANGGAAGPNRNLVSPGGAVSGTGTMHVTISAGGLITAYYQSTLVGSYQMTAPEMTNLGTYAGLLTYNQIMDNFSVS